MLNYELLRALDAVVTAGSFQAAARKLHITQSAVSQRIKVLEEQIGEPLIIRAHPPLPTKQGQCLLKHLREVQLLETELQGVARDFAVVAVGVNADSVATWFFDAFAPVLAERRLLCELLIDNEDQTYERLQKGEVLGCVTSRQRPFGGCDSDYLGKMRYSCLATPEFRKQYFARGLSVDSVRAAPALVFDRHDKMLDRFLRKQLGVRAAQYSPHRVPSPQAYLEIVMRGLAYGIIPELQLKPELRRARLVNLAPGKTVDVKLYFHSARRDTRTWREVRRDFVTRAQAILAT